MFRVLLFAFAVALLLPTAASAGVVAQFDKGDSSGLVGSAADDTPPISLSALRAQAKMAAVPVNQDGELNSLLERYIAAIEALPAEAPSDEPSDLAYCRCYLWQGSGDNAQFISPSQFAASQGVAGKYGAWVLIDGANLDAIPDGEGEEFFLDARLTTLAARQHTFAGGANVVIVLGRLEDRPAYVRSLDNPLDTYRATTIRFTTPSTVKRFRIDLRSGNQWLQKYYGGESEHFTYYYGFEGLRVNYFADASQEMDRVRLAWNGRYRIVADGQVGEFETSVIKPPRTSWAFDKSMRPSHRRIFYRAIARMKPTYRAILRQIAPYTRVKTHAGSGASQAWPYNSQGNPGSLDLPFKVSFARGHLSNRKFRNEVVAHELGHILDYAGLDDIAYSQFKKAFQRSKKWRRCKPDPNYHPTGSSVWPCLDDTELIADQLSYAALNKRSGVGGYGDPRLISSPAMMALLKRHYHFLSPYEGKLLTDSDWKEYSAIGEVLPEDDQLRSAESSGRGERPAVDRF